MSLRVNEIFYSLQGESSFAGYPCAFVRLSGCNLRCSYCDTPYAYDQGTEMEIHEIIQRISAFHCLLVEVTGGEPLIQDETPHLIRQLLDTGFQVLLETNGTQDVSLIDFRCVKMVDVKCPSSGQAAWNHLENLPRLTPKDEVKFIIGDREDYEYAKSILLLIGQNKSTPRYIHLSPIFGRMPYELLAGWILEDHLPVRMHLQMHKIIWPAETRGV